MSVKDWLKYYLGDDNARAELARGTSSEIIMRKLLITRRYSGADLAHNPYVTASILDRIARAGPNIVIDSLLARERFPASTLEILIEQLDAFELQTLALKPDLDEELLGKLVERTFSFPHEGDGMFPGRAFCALVAALGHPNATERLVRSALEKLADVDLPVSARERAGFEDVTGNTRWPLSIFMDLPLLYFNSGDLQTRVDASRVHIKFEELVYKRVIDRKNVTLKDFLNQVKTLEEHPSADMIITFLEDGWEGGFEDLIELAEALDA